MTIDTTENNNVSAGVVAAISSLSVEAIEVGRNPPRLVLNARRELDSADGLEEVHLHPTNPKHESQITGILSQPEHLKRHASAALPVRKTARKVSGSNYGRSCAIETPHPSWRYQDFATTLM